MTCEKARSEFPFLLYGELSFDQEEAVERHLDACAECRAALADEKAFHAALNLTDAAPPPGLLSASRGQLLAHLAREREASGPARGWSPSLRFGAGSWFSWARNWMRPAGALALLAIGFVSARVIPSFQSGLVNLASSGNTPDVVATRVRYVEPGANGGVNIVLEETRQRRVAGQLNDERVRNLLLSAAQDAADPGLRVESVELLKQESDAAVVRTALVRALRGDPNPGVRLKALDALKPYSREPEVRRVLSHVLLNDDNAGIRTQAVELLIQNRGQEMVGVLQELMRREDNDYIRLRTQRVLREMNASVDTF